MDQSFQRDVEAALNPQRSGALSCGWGSEAPGSRPCKETGCKNSALFHTSGYCSSCAVKHNVPLLTVTSAAATPDRDADETQSGL